MATLGKMDAETRADQAAAAVFSHRAFNFAVREISEASITELMVNLLYLSQEQKLNPVIMFCKSLCQYEYETKIMEDCNVGKQTSGDKNAG